MSKMRWDVRIIEILFHNAYRVRMVVVAEQGRIFVFVNICEHWTHFSSRILFNLFLSERKGIQTFFMDFDLINFQTLKFNPVVEPLQWTTDGIRNEFILMRKKNVYRSCTDPVMLSLWRAGSTFQFKFQILWEYSRFTNYLLLPLRKPKVKEKIFTIKTSGNNDDSDSGSSPNSCWAIEFYFRVFFSHVGNYIRSKFADNLIVWDFGSRFRISMLIRTFDFYLF